MPRFLSSSPSLFSSLNGNVAVAARFHDLILADVFVACRVVLGPRFGSGVPGAALGKAVSCCKPPGPRPCCRPGGSAAEPAASSLPRGVAQEGPFRVLFPLIRAPLGRSHELSKTKSGGKSKFKTVILKKVLKNATA